MREDRLSIANQLRLEHEAVLEIVSQVERLIGQPDLSAIGPGWCESLTRGLALLQSHLKNHFAFEEAGGFMEEVLRVIPSADHRIEQLRADHERFLAALDELSGFARRCTSATAPSIENLCKAVHEFLSDLRRHENQENNLVQTAFRDDLGTLD